MKDLIYLVLVIAIGVVVIKWYTSREPAAHEAAVKTLTVAEAKVLLDADEEIVLLDVRTQEEFNAGHIPGAICIPNETISPEQEFPFGKDVKLFLYCRSGRRSAEAAKKLVSMGYTDVTDFGGIIDWPYEVVTEET